MASPNKSVVITGASTGIGETAAQWLAARNWTVFAGYRSDKDAERLTALGGNIVPVRLDVTKPSDIAAAVDTVRQRLAGQKLGGLVNNAGIAMMAPLARMPMEDFRAHFEVNVFGLLAATQGFVPLLGGDDSLQGAPGRIVNITSVGGKVASPFLGAYVATKHACEALTDSLRRELVVYGIDAIAIGPGSVKTPIWAKAEEKNEGGPYADTPWGKALRIYEKIMLKGGRTGLPPEAVAKDIEAALTDEKPKARYAPVPDKMTNFILPSLMPKRMLDKVMWKRFALKT